MYYFGLPIPTMKSGPIIVAAFFLSYLFSFPKAFSQSYSHSGKDTAYVRMLNDQALELIKTVKYDSALSLLLRARNISQEIGDQGLLAKCLHNIGFIYHKKGEHGQSITYYEEALTILRKLNDQNRIPISLLDLGIAYKEQGLYNEALGYLFECIPLFAKNGDTIKLASAHNTIGNVHMLDHSYDDALKHHFKSLALRKKVNYEKGISGSLNNIGIVYKKTGNLDSALFYFNASLELKSTLSDKDLYANTLSHIAEIYLTQNKKQLSEDYYFRSHELRMVSGNKKAVALSYYDLAYFFNETGAYKRSEEYALTSLRLADSLALQEVLLKNYNLLRKMYRNTGEWKKALQYADLYIDLNDTLLGEEIQKLIKSMQIRFDTKEIEAANRAKDIELKVKKRNITYLLLLIVLLAFSLLVLLKFFRSRAAHAKRMDMVMRELHHRVENNLQIISSLLSLQSEKLRDHEAKEAMKESENRVNSMMLIHRNLYFEQEITRIKIYDYMRDLVNSLSTAYGFNRKSIKIDVGIDPEIYFAIDETISLGLLSNELISNAFKHAFGEENLTPELKIILIEKERGKYQLIIWDNGNGNITGNNDSFGLRLVESQVKRLKGTLHVSVENGLKYELLFP